VINPNKINLSDSEFFYFFVKNQKWSPFQNHGILVNNVLEKKYEDWPCQINAYLNLLEEINTKNKQILDLGCGWGRGTSILNNYYKCNIIGIDYNYDFITYAKNKFKNTKYILDDFLKTNLNNDSFDIILSNCSNHFFYNKKIYYQNLKNILKKEGVIIITDIFNNLSKDVFEKNLLEHNFKIEKIEDLTKITTDAMEYDVNTIEDRFKKTINLDCINAFKMIQEHRLYLFKKQLNFQFKYLIKNDIKK